MKSTASEPGLSFLEYSTSLFFVLVLVGYVQWCTQGTDKYVRTLVEF